MCRFPIAGLVQTLGTLELPALPTASVGEGGVHTDAPKVLASLWTAVVCSLPFSCSLAWALEVSLTLACSFVSQELLRSFPLLPWFREGER